MNHSFCPGWGGWCHLVPLAACRAFCCVEGKAGPQADPRLYDPITSLEQSWTLYRLEVWLGRLLDSDPARWPQPLCMCVWTSQGLRYAGV